MKIWKHMIIVFPSMLIFLTQASPPDYKIYFSSSCLWPHRFHSIFWKCLFLEHPEKHKVFHAGSPLAFELVVSVHLLSSLTSSPMTRIMSRSTTSSSVYDPNQRRYQLPTIDSQLCSCHPCSLAQLWRRSMTPFPSSSSQNSYQNWVLPPIPCILWSSSIPDQPSSSFG